MTAKARRVRPANNIKYVRQQLDELAEKMKGVVGELETELNRISSERKQAILHAHEQIDKLQRMWDRLANYVAKLAQELNE